MAHRDPRYDNKINDWSGGLSLMVWFVESPDARSVGWLTSSHSATIPGTACLQVAAFEYVDGRLRPVIPKGHVAPPPPAAAMAGIAPGRDGLEGWLADVLPPKEDTSQDCMTRLETLRAAYYGIERFQSTKPHDDLALNSGRPENHLAAAVGGTWTPEERLLRRSIQQLKQLGNGAAAFVLISPPFRERHARMLLNHQGEIFWIETLNGTGARVTPVEDAEGMAGPGARVIVLNPEGRAEPLSGDIMAPPTHADALLDRSPSSHYKGGGVELETRYIIRPPREIRAMGRDFLLFTDNATGITAESDTHEVPVSDDGRFVTWDEAEALGLSQEEVQTVKIVELKNHLPMRMAPRESGLSKSDTFRELRRVLGKLRQTQGPAGPDFGGVSVLQLFPPHSQRTYLPQIRDMKIAADPNNTEMVYAQFSAGVYPGAIADVLRFAQTRTWTAPGAINFAEHIEDALTFGDYVAGLFINDLVGSDVDGFYAAAMENVPEVHEVRSALALAYMQATALAAANTQVGGLSKSLTAIILRTALGAVHAALDSSVQDYFERVHGQIIDGVSGHYENLAGETLTARYNRSYPKKQLPPDADFFRSYRETYNGQTFSAANYLENILRPANRRRANLNQHDVLGVRTNFLTLDGGKAILEFRQHGTEYQTIDDVENNYDELEARVNAANARYTRLRRSTRQYGKDTAAAIRRLKAGRNSYDASNSRALWDLTTTMLDIAQRAFASYPGVLRQDASRETYTSNIAAEIAFHLDLFNRHDNSSRSRGSLERVVKDLRAKMVLAAGHGAISAWLADVDEWLLDLGMLGLSVQEPVIPPANFGGPRGGRGGRGGRGADRGWVRGNVRGGFGGPHHVQRSGGGSSYGQPTSYGPPRSYAPTPSLGPPPTPSYVAPPTPFHHTSSSYGRSYQQQPPPPGGTYYAWMAFTDDSVGEGLRATLADLKARDGDSSQPEAAKLLDAVTRQAAQHGIDAEDVAARRSSPSLMPGDDAVDRDPRMVDAMVTRLEQALVRRTAELDAARTAEAGDPHSGDGTVRLLRRALTAWAARQAEVRLPPPPSESDDIWLNSSYSAREDGSPQHCVEVTLITAG